MRWHRFWFAIGVGMEGLDKLARFIDVWRVWPRGALMFYMWQMYQVQQWAELQPALSNAQGFFISTVFGAFPFLLNFYMQQGNLWGPNDRIVPPANNFQPPPGSGTLSVAATVTPPGAPPASGPVSRGN